MMELFEIEVCKPWVRRFIFYIEAGSLLLVVIWQETRRYNANTLAIHTEALLETNCTDAIKW